MTTPSGYPVIQQRALRRGGPVPHRTRRRIQPAGRPGCLPDRGPVPAARGPPARPVPGARPPTASTRPRPPDTRPRTPMEHRSGSARPGMVTAAAVLAFVWGGLGILFGLLGLAAGSVLSSATSAVCNDATLDRDTVTACNAAGGLGSFLIIVTIGTIVIAGLMIWGGVVALNGKNGQILVIACGVYAAAGHPVGHRLRLRVHLPARLRHSGVDRRLPAQRPVQGVVQGQGRQDLLNTAAIVQRAVRWTAVPASRAPLSHSPQRRQVALTTASGSTQARLSSPGERANWSRTWPARPGVADHRRRARASSSRSRHSWRSCSSSCLSGWVPTTSRSGWPRRWAFWPSCSSTWPSGRSARDWRPQ